MQWSQLSLTRKLEVLIFILALPILVTLVFLLKTSAELGQAMEERSQYRDFLSHLSALQISMLNIETAYRGYALTGNERFLEPYKLGRTSVQNELDALTKSNIDASNVQQLNQKILSYINEWVDPKIKRVAGGELLTQANQNSLLEEGKSRFDELRGLFSDIERFANQRFDQSRAITIRGVDTLYRIAWLIALVVVIAIFTFRAALYRQIVRQLTQLHAATNQVALGDYGVRVAVTSGDEIGLLGTSFNQMAASLEQTNHELNLANQRDRILSHISDAMQNASTPEEVTQVALSGLSEVMGATNLYLSLLEGENLRLAGWWGPLFAHVEATTKEGQPINTASVHKLWEAIRNDGPIYELEYWSPERGKAVGLAVKPVRLPAGQIIGVLSVVRPSGIVWSDAEKEVMRRAAAAMGMALERAKNLTDLKAANAEYQRSNQELEQFAYVASHDLQEPLRMISSYTQLLARKYQGKLDEKADQYIHFAVDGAARMQLLIQDLLAYSRVGTKGKEPEPVDAKQVMQEVLRSLEVSIEESQAQVEVTDLPTLMADRVQLAQVLQNLIGNAIKYRDPSRNPHIRVRAEADGGQWKFWICDNGIGIEPQYFERIFVIFQRLHSKQEYSGSGIGLAIVRKIVERHGGKIGLESTPGQGSCFWFTWPGA